MGAPYHLIPGRPRLNLQHPLAQKLTFALLPGVTGMNNLVNVGPGLTIGTAAYGMSIEGPGAGATSTTNVAMYSGALPSNHPLLAGSNWTIYWRGALTTMNTGGVDICGIGQAASPWASIGLVIQPSGTQYAADWNNAGTGNATTAVNLPTIDGKTVGSIAATFSVSGNVQTYTNGAASGSPTAFGAAPSFTGAYLDVVGHQSLTAAHICNCLMMLMWNRALSATEIALLDANPYAMFQPSPSDIFQLPAAVIDTVGQSIIRVRPSWGY